MFTLGINLRAVKESVGAETIQKITISVNNEFKNLKHDLVSAHIDSLIF